MKRRFGCRTTAAVAFCLALAALSDARAQQRPSNESEPAVPLFEISREPIPGGAELLTVVGRIDAGLARAGEPSAADVPLVSVLRDTLGDDDPENDRLRYVWVHGYTTPSASQRLASAVPFLNRRTGNKDPSGEIPAPKPVIDLAAPDRDVWKVVMWMAAQSMLFDPYGALAKTSVRAFRRNDDDYRKAHIIRALAVLSLYEAETGAAPVLTPVEMRDIQARLMLAQKTFGGIVDDGYLQRAYERDVASAADTRGHNWELLRQRVEAEGLYFEPLLMPDGTATHALVWVARADVAATGRRFDSRFLNIASPWSDKRLREWTGFTETRYLDAQERPVPPDSPGARAVELIPLALYGLDHPKIPAVLIDFRDRGNPKRREASRRVLHDVTRHVLSLSPYGDLHYFLGRSIYNFVTSRRGMDINQPSRLRSYSQLKLLLSLSSSLDPRLAEEAADLVERVSMNPLQNDSDIEVQLAHRSYAALREAAQEPDSRLIRKVEGDRRAEYARTQHDRVERVMLRVATVLSAGIYRHREPAAPAEQLARVDVSRRLTYHRRFIKEVLASTPVIEVMWNVQDVRRSVQFLADHGSPADRLSVSMAARVFDRTADPETRRLSLEWLAKGSTQSARDAIARISESPETEPDLRALSLQYLGRASEPEGDSDVEVALAAGGD